MVFALKSPAMSFTGSITTLVAQELVADPGIEALKDKSRCSGAGNTADKLSSCRSYFSLDLMVLQPLLYRVAKKRLQKLKKIRISSKGGEIFRF